MMPPGGEEPEPTDTPTDPVRRGAQGPAPPASSGPQCRGSHLHWNGHGAAPIGSAGRGTHHLCPALPGSARARGCQASLPSGLDQRQNLSRREGQGGAPSTLRPSQPVLGHTDVCAPLTHRSSLSRRRTWMHREVVSLAPDHTALGPRSEPRSSLFYRRVTGRLGRPTPQELNERAIADPTGSGSGPGVRGAGGGRSQRSEPHPHSRAGRGRWSSRLSCPAPLGWGGGRSSGGRGLAQRANSDAGAESESRGRACPEWGRANSDAGAESHSRGRAGPEGGGPMAGRGRAGGGGRGRAEAAAAANKEAAGTGGRAEPSADEHRRAGPSRAEPGRAGPKSAQAMRATRPGSAGP